MPNIKSFSLTASKEKSFVNVDGRRTTDTCLSYKLSSGELILIIIIINNKNNINNNKHSYINGISYLNFEKHRRVQCYVIMLWLDHCEYLRFVCIICKYCIEHSKCIPHLRARMPFYFPSFEYSVQICDYKKFYLRNYHVMFSFRTVDIPKSGLLFKE